VRYSQAWRATPVRLKRSKPVRALFKRAYFCRTSDRRACLFPRVPGLLLRGREGSLFRD